MVRIYLNNAATSFPKPPAVIQAVNDYLVNIPFSAHRSSPDQQERDTIAECRGKMARLIGAESGERIIFTSGSTEALNLALFGLDFPEKRRHVVTTVTEHNSVNRPLHQLERRGMVTLKRVGCDSSGWVDPQDIRRALRPDTRALVINHCSNVTGRVQELLAIGEMAAERGVVFIVDASQSVGLIPIDVGCCRIDLLAFTGHKSLYATTGIGGLYIRPGIELAPLKYGGTGVHSETLEQPQALPHRYEAGTQNMLGIVALAAGLDFIAAAGLDAIRTRKEAWVERLRSRLQGVAGVRLLGQPPAALLSFTLPGCDLADAAYVLEHVHGFVLRAGLHCAPLIHHALGSHPAGTLRVSPSCFSSPEEADALAEAMGQVVAFTAGQ